MARNVWALVADKLQKRSLEAEDFYVLVRESRESIPYHIGQYGQNIPYRTKQTGMYNPPISYRKKYRPYRPISGNTSWYKKKVFFFFFLSFVIFEFLLGQNDNLFALTY